MLSVAWRVAGMENMGDDFSLNQDSGVVEPKCEFGLQIHFRATKAMNIKKNIRLEVCYLFKQMLYSIYFFLVNILCLYVVLLSLLYVTLIYTPEYGASSARYINSQERSKNNNHVVRCTIHFSVYN